MVLIVIFFLLSAVAGIVTDWLWYRELGRTDVYWMLFWGRWILGLSVGALFFLAILVNVLLALRETPDEVWRDIGDRLRGGGLMLAVERTVRRVAFWGASLITFLVALATGRTAAEYWTQFLLYTHAVPVGVTDPIFGRDAGFYLFRLPVWEQVSRWVFTALLIAFVLTALVYLLTRAIRTVRGMPVVSPAMERHLSILLALLFFAKAGQYLLGKFSLLYTDTGMIVGPGYADVHARIPGLTVMAVIAVLAGLVVLMTIRRRNFMVPLGVLVGVMVASLCLLGIYPALVQQFRVQPNQLELEKPYINNHIAMTRYAYGLQSVRVQHFAPTPSVTAAALAGSPTTLQNIRLWDYRPLLQIFRQRQGLRTYYSINNVDVDRYTINGQIRQVMLAARELNTQQIQGQQTWLTQHLIYTHGYGLVMSPVNEVDAQRTGPVFYISDIPPRSTMPELSVTRPEIYFGSAPSDYAVVRTGQKEYDFPQGDANQYTKYTGSAGVSLANPLVKLLVALRFGKIDFLISNYITEESRILFRRQVRERVQAVAPFLQFAQAPYLVLGTDGKLYWILEGYTRSDRFPYAQRSTLGQLGAEEESANYLRSPIRAVVDAYNGKVTLYVTDAQEPYIRAWKGVFPRLFHPITELPAGLDAHLRAPEELFNLQSDIYARYHMTDPTTFYQQEDLWDIPQETTAPGVKETMEAYYIIMTLPGSTQPEYLLIRPYQPKSRHNMIAWLSARNDPGHLGELLVYDFPKQSLVIGPDQIDSNIETDPEVSKDFSLWGGGGSRIWRGNLLVIPIDDSILFVRPIYLVAEQTQLPMLQRVIVADQQSLAMRTTLEEALSALTGSTVTTPSSTARGTAPSLLPPGVAPTANQRALARSALDHLHRAEAAQRQGDWALYGKELAAMRKDLEALNK